MLLGRSFHTNKWQYFCLVHFFFSKTVCTYIPQLIKPRSKFEAFYSPFRPAQNFKVSRLILLLSLPLLDFFSFLFFSFYFLFFLTSWFFTRLVLSDLLFDVDSWIYPFWNFDGIYLGSFLVF